MTAVQMATDSKDHSTILEAMVNLISPTATINFKMASSHHEIKVGSIVFLTDERSPPSKWPLARVTQLHPGTDNLTRVVTLKMATTQLTCPITKLAILLVPIGN